MYVFIYVYMYTYECIVSIAKWKQDTADIYINIYICIYIYIYVYIYIYICSVHTDILSAKFNVSLYHLQ